jgi:hypothetical protein
MQQAKLLYELEFLKKNVKFGIICTLVVNWKKISIII